MNRRDFITLGAVGTLAAAAGCRTSWRGGAPLFERDVKAACPEAKVLPGFTARGSNQIERRLRVGVTAHHTEDDVVRWLNGIF